MSIDSDPDETLDRAPREKDRDSTENQIEVIAAAKLNRPGDPVKTTGFWKASCGKSTQHLEVGQFFPAHHPTDIWTPDPR